MKNKKAFEFSFGWLFAILVGAFILFLAIFAVSRFIKTGEFETGTVSAKQIGILFTPVETGIEQAKLEVISVRKETKIFNDCVSPTRFEPFGSQKISANVQLGIGSENSIEGAQSTFRNKYLFSSKESNAKKEFYLFSMPFYFPFKLADLIILFGDKEKYCFIFDRSPIGTERKLKMEIEKLNPKNVFNASSANFNEACPQESKIVCFSGSCDRAAEIASDIIISPNSGAVEHKRERKIIYYTESSERENEIPLLFAAIFSNPDIYECQLKRIIKGRAVQLAELYEAKSDYLTAKGCSSAPVLPSSLQSYKTAASSFEKSQDLLNIKTFTQSLEEKNALLNCRLF